MRMNKRWPGVVAAVGLIAAVAVAVVVTSDAEGESLAAQPIVGASQQAAVDQLRTRLLTELVQRRTQALVSGDEAGWLADVDPRREDTVAYERMRFQNLRRLEPAHFRILPGESSLHEYKAAPLEFDILVTQVMRLPEDVRSSANDYRWYVSVTDDRITIGGVDEQPMPVGQDAARSPAWDDVALRTVRGERATVVSAQDGAWDPQAYTAAAERAARRVQELWRSRKSPSRFIVFLADDSQFSSWFDNHRAPMGSTIGVATLPQMVADDGGRYPSQRDRSAGLGSSTKPRYLDRAAGARIMLRMSKIKDMAHAEAVMVHEMTHALGPHLISPDSIDFGTEGRMDQPVWAIEGFARYVEHKSRPGTAEQGAAFVRRNMSKWGAKGFPVNKDFYSEDQDRTTFNYEIGAAFFLAAERAGNAQKAADLYIALTNSTQLTSGFINQDIAAAGLDPDRVWAAYRKLVG